MKKQIKELRYEVLNLRNMKEISTNAEIKLLHKLNSIEKAITVTRCCKSDSEQLLDFLEWKKQVAVDDLTDKEIVEFYLARKVI